MNEDWKKTKLGKAIDFYDSQRIPLSANVRKGMQGKYPYYGASGIIDSVNDFIFDGRYLLIAEDGENLRSRKTPLSFFAEGKFWVNNHAHIVLGKDGILDSDFLNYWFQVNDISSYITGAAQPKFSQKNLKEIEINLPPYDIQKEIVAIISPYDTLINKNLERIERIESSGQIYFQSLFGQDNRRLFGQKNTTLGEFVEVRKGKSITRSTIIQGTVPVVAGGLEPAYYHNEPNTKGPVITVSASGANAGFVNLYHEDIWASDCSYIDSTMTPHLIFIYLFLKTNQSQITNLQKGSAQPHVYPKDLMRLEIVIPEKELLEEFTEKVNKLYGEIAVLKSLNKTLTATRDLLIDNLITGKRELK